MELYERINMTESILSKLSEPAHITAERDMLKNQLVTLRKAERIMKHDPALAQEAESIEDEIRKQEEELRQAAENKKKKEEEKEKEKDKKKKEEEKTKKDDFDRDQKVAKSNEVSKAPVEKHPEVHTAEQKPKDVASSLFGEIGKKPVQPAKKNEKSLFG